MKGWDGSVTEISATGLKIFHMNTPSRLPGRNICDKIASLSQQSGQNGIISSCMYF